MAKPTLDTKRVVNPDGSTNPNHANGKHEPGHNGNHAKQEPEPKQEPSKELNYKELLASIKVTDFEALPDYETAVFLPEPLNEPLLYKRTFNVVQGAAGTRKSTFIASLMASTSKAKRVLLFDTEQAEEDLKYLGRGMVKQGANMQNVTVIPVMRITAEQAEKIDYLKLFNEATAMYKPDFAIIDNLTDIDNNSVMDNTAAANLIRSLSRNAKHNDFALLAVVHENEGFGRDDTGRGHAGKEGIRKAHVVIRLQKESESSTRVTFRKTRRKSPNEFIFEVDAENTPIYTGAVKVLTDKEIIKSPNFAESLKSIFAGKELTKGATIEAVQKVFGLFLKDNLSTKKAGELIPKIECLREVPAKGNKKMYKFIE